MSETRILIRLLRIYFPQISEFGSASEFRGGGGGGLPPKTPSNATGAGLRNRAYREAAVSGIAVVEQNIRWYKLWLQQRGEGASAWKGVVPIGDRKEFCEFVHLLLSLLVFTYLDNLLLIVTSHQVSEVIINANWLSPVKSLTFMLLYCHRSASPCS
jgi:hypothetical protein